MKRQWHRRQSTAGFTLLELLVVIVMAGILASIAGVSWLSFLNRQRVTSARDQVQQAIRLAQSEALRTKSERQVTFDTTVNPPIIAVGTPTQPRQSADPLGNGELEPGMVSFQPSVTSITFDNRGNLAVNAPLPIVFTFRAPANTGPARCLIVETILGATRNADRGEPGCS